MSIRYQDFQLGSIEHLRARVRIDNDLTDPTGLTVAMALVPEGTAPTGPDFKTAVWELGGPPYHAHILAGAGGDVVPTAGTFDLWVRVTDTPEVPLRLAGKIVVR